MKNWFGEVSPAKRRFVLVLPAIVFGIIFSAMIPAQADTPVAPGSGDATNLEIGPTMSSVEVDDVGEVPFVAIVVALAASVWLLVSSLGPRGLQVLTAIGDRRR